MGVDYLRGPDHQCDLPHPRQGAVVRCDECGQIWKGHTYPNPNYNGWRRVSDWWAKWKGWI